MKILKCPECKGEREVENDVVCSICPRCQVERE